MSRIWTSAVALIFAGVTLSAAAEQAAPRGPDLSGRWNRESPAAGAPADSPWGSSVRITQTGSNLTIQPDSGTPRHYRLDGTESAQVLFASGCTAKMRITKAVATPATVTITTWIVNKTGCAHGETRNNPMFCGPGPIDVRDAIGGNRELESITSLSRDGGGLAVDSTRSNPGAAPVSTSTTYRK